MIITIKKIIIPFFIVSIVTNAQNRTEINGLIISDSINIVNTHVLNNNTNKGTITNIYGEFKINVKLNDVLILTSITFKTVRKIILEKDISEGFIEIKMNSLINQLNEVNINNHELTGNLLDDSENTPINFMKNNTYRIDMSGINLENPGKLNNSDDYVLSDPLVTSETVNSIDFIKVFKSLTKGRRKKTRVKKAYQDLLIKIPDKIRKELGDPFFIHNLKISKPLINDFIIYCNSKNIFSLYNQNKKIEMIEILIKQSKIYLNEITTYKN